MKKKHIQEHATGIQLTDDELALVNGATDIAVNVSHNYSTIGADASLNTPNTQIISVELYINILANNNSSTKH